MLYVWAGERLLKTNVYQACRIFVSARGSLVLHHHSPAHSLTLPPEEVVLLVVHVHRPALSARHALLETEQLGEDGLHRAPAR